MGRYDMKTAALTLVSLTLAFGVSVPIDQASAQQLSNSMTCKQAQNLYSKQKRINTRTRSGSVVPIYGGIPVDTGKQLFCGREATQGAVNVITKDKRSCPIAYKCF